MTDTPDLKKPKSRSTAYPGMALGEAIDATKQLRDNFSSTPFSRDSAAIALGYKGVNGASATKIAACAHFGLLVREGSAYKQSELADQILVATTDEERLAGIRTAFTKPALYKKLAEEYNDKALPKMLDNILVRQHGITERAAKEAATVFVQSAEYAGVLTNGIIKLDTADAVPTDEPTVAESGMDSASQPQGHTAKPANMPAGLPVSIPDTGVTIVFPMEYAFALSTGAFTEGIRLLANNIKAVQAVSSDEQSADTTES